MPERSFGGYVKTGLFGRKNEESIQSRLMPIGEVAALSRCGCDEFGSERLLLAPIAFPPSQVILLAFENEFGDPATMME